jgi:hypothetical protein
MLFRVEGEWAGPAGRFIRLDWIGCEGGCPSALQNSCGGREVLRLHCTVEDWVQKGRLWAETFLHCQKLPKLDSGPGELQAFTKANTAGIPHVSGDSWR